MVAGEDLGKDIVRLALEAAKALLEACKAPKFLRGLYLRRSVAGEKNQEGG